MEMRRKQPIGVELVRRGVVTEADIEKALEYQRKNPKMKLGDILYELDVCDPNTLIAAMGEILGAKGILLTTGLNKETQDMQMYLNDYTNTNIKFVHINTNISFEQDSYYYKDEYLENMIVDSRLKNVKTGGMKWQEKE